jgi:NADH dehydrogenase
VVKEILVRGGFEEGTLRGRSLGVFATDAALACVGRPGYWAVGDNAGVPDPEHAGELCPPTAQFAIRQARVCAENILAAIEGRQLSRFRYRNLGMIASLGQRRAVADVFGFRFSGFLAWVIWRAYYLSQLPGFVRKLRVALDWTLDFFVPRDIAQIQASHANRLRVDHYEPGEIIISKHEIGRELFIVKRGDVEVFQPAEDGAKESVVATLTKGDVFGEKALLEDTTRTASVRAKTAVDLLVISREDFTAMVCQVPLLDAYFDKLMKERYPEHVPPAASIAHRVALAVRPPGTGRQR